MAKDKTKTTSKRTNTIKSIAWLIEAGFRTFTGWVLLSNFDHFVAVGAGIYALATAGVIVVMHFVGAHK